MVSSPRQHWAKWARTWPYMGTSVSNWKTQVKEAQEQTQWQTSSHLQLLHTLQHTWNKDVFLLSLAFPFNMLPCIVWSSGHISALHCCLFVAHYGLPGKGWGLKWWRCSPWGRSFDEVAFCLLQILHFNDNFTGFIKGVLFFVLG